MTATDRRDWRDRVVAGLGALGLVVLLAATVAGYGLSAMAVDPCGTPQDDPDCFANAATIRNGIVGGGLVASAVLVATTLWPGRRERATRGLGLLAVPAGLIVMLVFGSRPVG